MNIEELHSNLCLNATEFRGLVRMLDAELSCVEGAVTLAGARMYLAAAHELTQILSERIRETLAKSRSEAVPAATLSLAREEREG